MPHHTVVAGRTVSGIKVKVWNRLVFNGTLVMAIIAPDYAGPWAAFAITFLVVLFVVIATIYAKEWLAKTNGRLALVLGLSAFILWLPTEMSLSKFLNGAAFFRTVILLLISISVIRLVFLATGLDKEILSIVTRVGRSARLHALLLTSFVGTFAFSLAVVNLAGAMLRERSRPSNSVPRVVMRGVCATMFLAPTTAAVGVVSGAFSEISWGAIAATGFPLSVLAVLLSLRVRGMVSCKIQKLKDSAVAIHQRRLGFMLVGWFLAGVFLCHQLLDTSPVVSVSLSGLLLLVPFLWLAPMFHCGDETRSPWIWQTHFDQFWPKIIPEVVLFMVSGILITVLRQPFWHDLAAPIAGVLAHTGMWGVAVVVLGLPTLSLAGIHPIVLFSVFSSFITSELLGVSSVVMYMSWVSMFMISMLISPIAILTILTGSSFGLSTWHIGFRSHAVYASIFGGLVVIYLGFIVPFFEGLYG